FCCSAAMVLAPFNDHGPTAPSQQAMTGLALQPPLPNVLGASGTSSGRNDWPNGTPRYPPYDCSHMARAAAVAALVPGSTVNGRPAWNRFRRVGLSPSVDNPASKVASRCLADRPATTTTRDPATVR